MLALITLHDQYEKDFSKNGFGRIDDYISEDTGGTWELNGEFKIAFAVPITCPLVDKLKKKNIIKAPVPFMEDQLFRIYRVEEGLSTISIEARHIFYDLLDNWVEDTNVVSKEGNGALNQILSATLYGHRFEAWSNIGGKNNARIVRMNPVQAFLDDEKDNSFISRWGGELYRNNFRIEMLTRVGEDNGVEIRQKRELTGYKSTVDYSTVYTRIHPVGFDGLTLPEKYIDSPLMDPAHPIVTEIKYRDIKAAVGEYADDEDAVPLAEAYKLLRQAAKDEFSSNHIDEPETVVNVDFVALNNTQEYADLAQLQTIRGGDTVKVILDDRDTVITSRLVAFNFSLLQENQYTGTTLGNHVLEFTSSNSGNSELNNRLDEQEEQTLDWLNKIREEIVQSYFNDDGYNYDLRAGNDYDLPGGFYSFDRPIYDKPTKVIYMGAGKLLIANSKKPNGDWNWRTAATGDGIVADVIATGTLRSEIIKNSGIAEFGDVESAENSAKKHADEVAKAQAKLAEEEAKANADGKITAEEKARIKQAKDNLAEAKTHANNGDKGIVNDLKASGETIINGDNITTGVIKDSAGVTTLNLKTGLMRFNHSDGTYTQAGVNGFQRYTSADNRTYNYLVYATNFVYGSASASSPRWIQLPNDFKGKKFQIFIAISDSMNAKSFYRAIQRIVVTQHPSFGIDYKNARVPIIAYKSETQSDGKEPEITSVQGMLLALY